MTGILRFKYLEKGAVPWFAMARWHDVFGRKGLELVGYATVISRVLAVPLENVGDTPYSHTYVMISSCHPIDINNLFEALDSLKATKYMRCLS
jgi:hypothetical protein